MDISKGYFALQLQFAARVVQVGHLTVEEALLNYTNLYLAFINRTFDPAHPIWQEYLESSSLWLFGANSCSEMGSYVCNKSTPS